jgi:hypothetical protein
VNTAHPVLISNFSKIAITVCNNIFTGHLSRYAGIFIFSLSVFGTSDLKFSLAADGTRGAAMWASFTVLVLPALHLSLLPSVYLVPALKRQIIEMMLTVSLY